MCRVLPRKLAYLVNREVADLLFEDALGIGPSPILVRIVRFEQDVIDTDYVPLFES